MTKKRYRKVLGLIEDSNGNLLDLTEIQNEMNQLNDENEQLKIQIKIFEMFLKENNLDIDWINFCGLDHLCIANDNDFKCQYCPCLDFKGCFDD